MIKATRLGLLFAAGAYASWGITPLYWKLFKDVPVFEITIHRIIWAFVFLLTILFLKKRTSAFLNLLKNSRTRYLLILNAALIGSNWFVYVHAINTNHVVDASLGYFINPLLSVSLGILFFNERPSHAQIAAIFFAIIGVTILIWDSGNVPWTALILASTFALYGLIRKKIAVDTLAANTGEVLMMLPLAGYFLWGPSKFAIHAFDYSLTIQLLLISCGAVTAIPLLLFAESTKHLRLATVGFLQYISPSLQFLLGVFVFHEPFGSARLLSFSLIWIGLGLYTYDLIVKPKS